MKECIAGKVKFLFVYFLLCFFNLVLSQEQVVPSEAKGDNAYISHSKRSLTTEASRQHYSSPQGYTQLTALTSAPQFAENAQQQDARLAQSSDETELNAQRLRRHPQSRAALTTKADAEGEGDNGKMRILRSLDIKALADARDIEEQEALEKNIFPQPSALLMKSATSYPSPVPYKQYESDDFGEDQFDFESDSLGDDDSWSTEDFEDSDHATVDTGTDTTGPGANGSTGADGNSETTSSGAEDGSSQSKKSGSLPIVLGAAGAVGLVGVVAGARLLQRKNNKIDSKLFEGRFEHARPEGGATLPTEQWQ